jgi:hypothetical protein
MLVNAWARVTLLFQVRLIFSIIDAVEKRFFAETFEKQFFFYFLQSGLRCIYFFHHAPEVL